jgi:SAM-dependent methyltransferase
MSTPQIDRSHYRFEKYAFEGRFVSYYWQLKEALAENPSSVLEVGVGERVFGSYIKENTGASYTSVDIAPDLEPDRVASVLALPFPDKSFDAVCAFEVLEHLPFEDFEKAVSELCRVARNRVCISLPHFGPMLSFSLKIPFLPEIRLAWKIPFPKKHVFNGQHYWEVGKRGFPPSRIRSVLRKHGALVADFVPFGSPYHHFFTVSI